MASKCRLPCSIHDWSTPHWPPVTLSKDCVDYKCQTVFEVLVMLAAHRACEIVGTVRPRSLLDREKSQVKPVVSPARRLQMKRRRLSDLHLA